MPDSPLAISHGLKPSFYKRPTLDVARDLLGTRLHRRLPSGEILSGAILEVEAYTADDPACHAFRGPTPRASRLFGPPGLAYVYFIYGMYWCLNAVTEPDGIAGAVLIRAVDYPNCNGPGKLCKTLGITGRENGLSLMDPASGIWISSGVKISDDEVEITPRIGIKVAQERMWRFHVKDHNGVSGQKPRRHKKA